MHHGHFPTFGTLDHSEVCLAREIADDGVVGKNEQGELASVSQQLGSIRPGGHGQKNSYPGSGTMPHQELAVKELAVLLLLGGQSRRMGTPKHLLQHPLTQEPLYRHHLSTLRRLSAEGVFPRGVWVSARQDQLETVNLPEVGSLSFASSLRTR